MEWPGNFPTDEPTPIRRRLQEPNPWPDSFAVPDEPSPIKRQLQGPRPTPLRVSKDSHKIKKPPVVPHHHSHPPRPPQPPAAAAADRQPVIIYAVSPKVIHTTADDFMNLVQRLTGPSSCSLPSPSTAAGGVDHFPAGGAVSPAARLASIEKTSPCGRERDRERGSTDLMGMMFSDGVEMGQMMPGILSPAPASLAPISSGFFSPGFDTSYNPFFSSGFFSPAGASNTYMPSPSTLFSAPMVSPSPSSYDLLSQFLDF